MAAKINKTVKISLQNGSAASGKTVPGPGAVRGGGQTAAAAQKGGSNSQNTGGGGFGRAAGIAKRRGGY